jgi:ribosomal protein L39E
VRDLGGGAGGGDAMKEKTAVPKGAIVGKRMKVSEHPAFGMWKDRFTNSEVPAFVRSLRKARKGSSLS